MNMQEKYFNYQGLSVRYLEKKPDRVISQTVVLLHGWGSNADLFGGAMEFLATKYQVVAPDLPGFGKSEEPKEPYDLDDYVDFAVAFTKHILNLKNSETQKDSSDAESNVGSDELKGKSDRADAVKQDYIPEVIMLGHSHGGRVIIRLLARAEKAKSNSEENETTLKIAESVIPKETSTEILGFRVSKAILTDSAGIVPEKTEAQKKRTEEYKRYKAILTKTGLAKMAPGLMDKLQKKYGSADYAAASPVMRQSMVKVVNTDLRAEMPSIKIPVLLIWGDADTATPLSDGKEMERLMPEAGLAVIPGGTHFCFLENPVLYNRILGSFLGV